MYHSTGFMWFMWLAFCGKLSFSQAILEVELEEKSYAMCLKHAGGTSALVPSVGAYRGFDTH